METAAFTAVQARRLEFVREAGFLAEQNHVYYVVTTVDDDLQERNLLWLDHLEGGGSRCLGEELRDVTAPTPSPDGRLLAVLAKADGNRQIFLVSVSDGEPRQLTTLTQGVIGGLAWSPDGRSIAFTAGPEQARDPLLPYRIDRVTYRFDGIGYLDDVATDLYVVSVETGSVQRLTNDRCMNSDPRWSPDGRFLSYLVSFWPDRAWTFLPELHLLDVESRQSRTLLSSWGGVLAAEWCPDGKRVAFVGAPVDDDVVFSSRKVDVWTIDLVGGEPECRTASVVTGVGYPGLQTDLPIMAELGAPRLRVNGEIAYARGQVGGEMVVYAVGLSGTEAVEIVLARRGSSAYLLDFHPDRGFLYLATSFIEPPELMLNDKRITALNDAVVSAYERPQVHELSVTAPDGVRTEAWALTPAGAGPWPAVLCIHGGPYGAFGSVYVIDFHLLVAAGFAVVFNNFRGSYGYGSAFSHMILGDWGRQGSIDHHATADEAIRSRIADPDRLGVFGLSHGGFATCWLLGTSDRFKAGVAENPVTNFASSFGVLDTSAWLAAELGGPLYEHPDVYRERSALTYASNCKTPLLFIVGEADWRCHATESEQYYRVLTSRGVPTEMLRLPNSSHVGSACGPVVARIAQNEALVDWFRRYLHSNEVCVDPAESLAVADK